MGFLKNFSINIVTEDENDTNEVVNTTVKVSKHTMKLCSLERRILAEVDDFTTINLRENREKSSMTMFTETPNGETVDFLTCCYISAEDKRDIERMLNILLKDLRKAKTKKTDVFIIPQNDLDLYAYIQNRPSIEIDMDDLYSEINSDAEANDLKAKTLRTNFIKEIQVGKKVNVFVANNSIYNTVACHLLKQAYGMHVNVHFFNIDPQKHGDPVYWSNPTIEAYRSLYPNVMSIGIGIYGQEPTYTLSLLQNEEKSVIAQAASLTMSPLNAREELLEAQATGHSWKMMQVGENRQLGQEVIKKAIKDMAKEAALFKYDESTWNEFENMAIKSKRIENGLCIVRLPFNDKSLIQNYFIESNTGVLAIIGDKELYYYGEQKTVELLVDDYEWTSTEEKVAYKIFENRTAIYELSDMTTKREFIKAINNIIDGKKNIKETYTAISDVSKRFNSTMGINMERQFKLLKYVDSLKNDESRMKSVKRIITESLTLNSPFKKFGELFSSHNFFS